MSEYRKLNLNKLHFAKTPISYKEAIKNATPCTITGNQIQITEVEKDYTKRTIKLKIAQ